MAARRTHMLSAVAHARIRAASLSGCALRTGPTRRAAISSTKSHHAPVSIR